ncbi:hypothetical protein [Ruegeria marisrubri]
MSDDVRASDEMIRRGGPWGVVRKG